MPQIPSPPLPLPPLPPPPSSPPQSLLQLCIEPQEVNSVANTISTITRTHHQPPNNVHLSYSGDTECVIPRQLAHQLTGW